ncbi:lipoprotein [Spiroplasma endosymbiont of Stenodema calcarata]|uniref:lipoprotein n=1 Tax=Spiroplasma endosymbiont of Stenodema calcarata TaxID=3139328 RepID=UPI003CCA92F9
MKKLLALLGAISLVGTSAVSVVACNHRKEDNASVDEIKKELEQYIDTPFFASSSAMTNDKLASELASRITLGSYKLVVKADSTFVPPTITDGNTLQAQTSQEFKEQLTETKLQGALTVNNGTANVSLQKSNSEIFGIKIQWSTNELLFLASTVNKINVVGEKTQNIKFPLPPILPGLDITLADLYSFLSVISLPTELINKIDLANIDTPEFVTNFDLVLKEISNSLAALGIGNFLTTDLSFSYEIIKAPENEPTKGLNITGTGTVNDLLHNVAPDIIALLQWYIKEGQEKITTTHNTVLPLLQYLLSPVNSNLKENIKTEFGDDWFYKNTATNFDSLVFHLLAGYKGNIVAGDSHYTFKIIGQIDTRIIGEIELDDVIDQDLIGKKGHGMFIKSMVNLQLNPALLITSILDIFAKNDGKGIDAVKETILQPSTWKGINDMAKRFTPAINVFFGPTIMSFAGPSILRNLGLSNTEINNNDITMSAGTVKLQLKNKNNIWEDFKAITNKDNDTLNLEQLLNARDVKISFMDVKFKVTPKNNDKIAYETNGNVNFDLWLSDLMN